MIKFRKILEMKKNSSNISDLSNKQLENLKDYYIQKKVNDIHINRNSKAPPQAPTVCSYGQNVESIYKIDLVKYQCRGQTKNLYKFNNLVQDDKDCLFCEQVFNNQTKRKHISVGNVPQYILNQNWKYFHKF